MLKGQLKLCVFSNDLKLLELCREIASDLRTEPCDVIRANPDSKQILAADLVVWDFNHNDWPHGDVNALHGADAQERLFLVDRLHAEEFLRTMPLGVGSTLTKPVSRSLLRNFMEQAALRTQAKRWNVRPIPRSLPEPDRHDLLQCLLIANLKLQEHEQDRTNFLTRAVHDFRAPLTAASGYCGLLREQVLGPLNRDQTDLLRRMEQSLKKLTRIAFEMLELSAPGHRDRKVELKECSIESCIRCALQDVELWAGEKHIAVGLELSEPGAPLVFDPEQIEQVLANLIESAFKFTPKGGHVDVRGYPIRWTTPNYSGYDRASETQRHEFLQAATAYRIDVSDTSAGIPTEHLDDVFEEHTSYGGSQDRSGGGLGLAICRRILKAHGGYISAGNHQSGARLSLFLPLGDLSTRRPIQFGAQARVVPLRDVSFTEEDHATNA